MSVLKGLTETHNMEIYPKIKCCFEKGQTGLLLTEISN